MVGPSPDADRDRIRDGLRLFNEERFFEAHEALEDVWHLERGEPRLFLQGLIQICAGFHHFQSGNASGAVALLRRGADKMRTYPDRYLGLDATAILASVDACRDRIERTQVDSDTKAVLEFPKIQLDA